MTRVTKSELLNRATKKANQFVFSSRIAWMTLVILVRRSIGEIAALPFSVKRRLSPAKVVAACVLAILIAAPATAYFIEKGNHSDTRRAFQSWSAESASEVAFLKASLRELLDENDKLTEHVLDSGTAVYMGNKIHVKVVATGYSSSVFETDETPFLTAANTSTREGILALSRDLLREFTPGAPFSFGDRVHVSGLGEFLVEDVMNARWTNRVDVWFPSRLDAIHFGLREAYLTGTIEDDPFTETDVLTEPSRAIT
ncbi:MAG: 3D domain-containing protein, partial [Candidatus Latescibacterota bacterium]